MHVDHITPSDAERFWSKVQRVDGDGCWEWTGARARNRWGFEHGRFRLPTGHAYAHRISWMLTNGPIPAGQCVLHRCDNPPCVRPDHLFLGTNDENMADMVAKGRAARGERSALAKLTEAQVREIRAEPKWLGVNNWLSEKYGVNNRCISAIRLRRTWKHVS